MSSKSSLTPEEKLRAAHAVIILGVKQHDVAAILSTNAGRVAEAVSAVRSAIGMDTAEDAV